MAGDWLRMADWQRRHAGTLFGDYNNVSDAAASIYRAAIELPYAARWVVELTMNRFWEKVLVDDSDKCWEWSAATVTKWKYGAFRYNGKTGYAHRFSWELHNGKIPNGLFVLHKCDNPSCVNPEHLFLGTHSDNMIDMDKKGRRTLRKLTPEIIREIRSSDESLTSMAGRLGVAISTVGDTRNRKRWEWVND